MKYLNLPHFNYNQRILLVPVLVVFIVLCYAAYGYRLDKEMEQVQYNLGIPTEKHVFGYKSLDKMGRLVRRAGNVQCPAFDGQECADTAGLHLNCLPKCASGSSYPLCQSLQENYQKAESDAVFHCFVRSSQTCPLNTNPDGSYDYSSFNECCAFETAAPSCLCSKPHYVDDTSCSKPLALYPSRFHCIGQSSDASPIYCN